MREKGLPPRADWNVNVALTGSGRAPLSALLMAFDADVPGLTVNLTTPAATRALPLAKTTREPRQRPPRRTYPALHVALVDANTPNLPFSKVISQLKVPGSATSPVNVSAPVFSGFKANEIGMTRYSAFPIC